VKVVLICEGSTERALVPGLRELIQKQMPGRDRVGLTSHPLNGPVYRAKLTRIVDLHGSSRDVGGIIALTDVYPEFNDADEAKKHLARLVEKCEYVRKFRAHAAQFDVEAWLVPSWKEIAKSLNVPRQPPSAHPEQINRDRPPSFHFADLYQSAKRKYSKPIAARRWFTPENLERAADQCRQLKSLLDSILEFAAAEPLP
jgi:hypothetical protein